MSVSRRQLLRCGPAFLATVVVPWKVFGASNNQGDDLLSKPKTGFLPLLRNTFTVNASSIKPTWLMLESIDDFPMQAPSYETRLVTRPNIVAVAPKTESFVLRFSATGEPLSQGTYELDHSAAGRIQLFLVPAGGSSYSAVINHLTEPLPPNYSIPRSRKSQPAASTRTANRPEQQP